jgi:hypothetical protein
LRILKIRKPEINTFGGEVQVARTVDSADLKRIIPVRIEDAFAAR